MRVFRETLKDINFTEGNKYFQGFEDNTNAKTMVKILGNIDVFWDFVFEGILGGFWEAFGRPKTLIFALFSMFFRSKFWKTFWKGKKSKKRASAGGPPEIFGPGGQNVRGPGER